MAIVSFGVSLRTPNLQCINYTKTSFYRLYKMIDRMKTCRELHDVKIANQSGSMVSNIIAWAVYGVPDSHWHFELPAIVPPRSEMRAGERYLESRGAGYSILAQPTSCHHHLSTNFDNSIYYCTFKWLYIRLKSGFCIHINACALSRDSHLLRCGCDTHTQSALPFCKRDRKAHFGTCFCVI